MVLLLWMASPASALGVGSTGALGIDGWYSNPFDYFPGSFDASGFAPSLDLRADPVIVQFHVLEFTEALIDDEDLFLGADVLFQAHDAPLHGAWLGVVQPGFGVNVFGDPFLLGLTGECRLGAEVQDGAGIGAYVVPEAGLALGDGNLDWIAGGSLQLSVWFGG